ncbi:DExH-box splicing factor binding site-domain-containing protein [Abortiporus biennis]|nr:DExH-box splicing factor binding site-domain-containing protein [Abortiporus biennis]
MSSSKLSFTIRRPTPVSRASSTGAESDSSGFKVPALPRHLQSANNSNPGSPLGHSNSPKRGYSERDSSDEEDDAEDELVTGFDQFGVQRLHAKKEPEGPLVIPALKNKDWREVARKRKNLYIPPSASAVTGADGSVGGLGTRDSINSGPQLSGLQLNKKPRLEETLIEVEDKDVKMEEQVVTVSEGDAVLKEETQETEDQRALKAIIASATSGDGDYDGPTIDTIPMHASEEDALQQDIAELPEPATLEDYERVPVSQFGAALLRGMGWKEGTAASRKTGKGLVEPWLPQARPALLGIGAKEKAPLDDGSSIGKKGGPRKSKPNMKYMPLVKVDRGDGSREGSTDRDRESRPGSSSRREGSR